MILKQINHDHRAPNPAARRGGGPISAKLASRTVNPGIPILYGCYGCEGRPAAPPGGRPPPVLAGPVRIPGAVEVSPAPASRCGFSVTEKTTQEIEPRAPADAVRAGRRGRQGENLPLRGARPAVHRSRVAGLRQQPPHRPLRRSAPDTTRQGPPAGAGPGDRRAAWGARQPPRSPARRARCKTA